MGGRFADVAIVQRPRDGATFGGGKGAYRISSLGTNIRFFTFAFDVSFCAMGMENRIATFLVYFLCLDCGRFYVVSFESRFWPCELQEK